MSYQTSKYINLVQWQRRWIFAGGFVDNTPDSNMLWCYSTYLRNARLDWQSITNRPWHQLFASLTDWSYPKWIGSYLRASSANDRLIVRHNTDATHKLYTIDAAGTATSIATAALIASDNRMRFLNVADVVYCMNGSDQFWKLSNVTYSQPTTVPALFAPSFWVAFDWKAVVSGRSTNPNKIYFSVADNYEDFTSAGTDIGTSIEQVTGLASTNQALFYFTTNTISVTDSKDIVNTAGTISYNSSYLQTKEWAINHDSIVVVGTDVYYMTPSNSIKKIARGQNVAGFESFDLSDRENAWITNFLWAMPQQTDARAYYQEDTNSIHWFLKSTSTSTIYDITLIYDILHDAFLVDTNRYFYGGVFFKGKNYSISTIEPKVFRDEYSYDDQGSPIPFEYRTKSFYLSWDTFKSTLRESRTLMDMNTLAEVTQTIRIDWWQVDTKTLTSDNLQNPSGWIGTEPVGEFAIGTEGEEWVTGVDLQEIILLRTKGNLNKKGIKAQRRWTMWSVAGRIRLKSVNPRVEWLPPEATSIN